VLLAEGEYPRRAEFGLTLTDDVSDPARHARAIRVFPERTDRDYFKVDLQYPRALAKASMAARCRLSLSLPAPTLAAEDVRR
jgi:hypothetical protein